MKSDMQIQKDVMEELRWEPILTSSEIGVAVKNGVVTLSGIVDSYTKKMAAENAAKRVAGVKALAEDIQIGVSPAYKKTDSEIAQAVLDALKWHSAVQEDKIDIKVDDGIVRLEGEVDWDYQRTSAKSAIENLNGVRLVVNLIRVKPKVEPVAVRDKIDAAFRRTASIDANKVKVQVTGSKVILKGTVRSFAEKSDAEHAAWSAPGVTSVESKLDVVEPVMSLQEM